MAFAEMQHPFDGFLFFFTRRRHTAQADLTRHGRAVCAAGRSARRVHLVPLTHVSPLFGGRPTVLHRFFRGLLRRLRRFGCFLTGRLPGAGVQLLDLRL